MVTQNLDLILLLQWWLLLSCTAPAQFSLPNSSCYPSPGAKRLITEGTFWDPLLQVALRCLNKAWVWWFHQEVFTDLPNKLWV